MTAIRCFIGFALPDADKSAVIMLQRAVSLLPFSCKLVEPENLHVCLSFLGEISDGELPEIESRIDSVCSNQSVFGIRIGKIKLVPSDSYVRVVLLEVLDDSGRLEKISSELKEKVGGSVKPPHITLCRVKKIVDKAAFLHGIKALRMDDLQGIGGFDVDSVSLIKSELYPNGPAYTVVRKFAFKRS